ncbi:MAG TPA: DUF1365 domain-containing protein [Chitinophagales bacterium]|nr:DUF1365 domain-containing protein [Chitinophagales bacterium]HNF69299.1 DUF1365 domain-containing protein [Chitinophagales bacterium]
MTPSTLYTCLVMHNRLSPKKHRFNYKVFMFFWDIDNSAEIAKSHRLLSYNKGGVFSFRDRDHFKYPEGDNRNELTVRAKLNAWLKENGVVDMPEKVMLLTHIRMFGYVFNPVSFYFCYNASGDCLYVVTEISNTFGEMKIFLIDQKQQQSFEQEDVKYFYVSPFTDMDTSFRFKYQLPSDKLNLRIDVQDRSGDRFFISTLTGARRTLSDLRLLWYVVRFPFITLQVIGAIHWHAFLLWLKKVPWHRKTEQASLQRDILNKSGQPD